jgi:DNA-directed RNA polymerase specialized sigma subunit
VLTAFAAAYRQREESLERATEMLRADRDQAIRKAYNEGMAMSEIATVLGLSHQRVSQIVRS